jgi:1-acyl-sn-glycerol-3-phosphate acyltransferase
VPASAEVESSIERQARRAITVPLLLLVWAFVIAILPFAALVAGVVDAARRSRGSGLRALFVFVVYLSCEVIGVVAALLLWFTRVWRDEARHVEQHYRLQRWWAGTIFDTSARLFDLHVVVEGREEVLPGPVLVLMRHVSVADTLLPVSLLGRPLGLRLRHVMKRELLRDPCLDIVGQRLPNAFVRRGSGQASREIDALRTLGRDLGDRDGVLIFPEGTRFSEQARKRALERLRAGRTPELATRAEQLRHVLPPHLGGVLGLLDENLHADVVIAAHVGFEGTRSLAEFWRGALVGRTIRLRLWREGRAAIPEDTEARIAWLYGWWETIDAWVDAELASARS